MEVGELFFIMLAIQHLVQKLHTGPQDKAKPVSLSGNIGLQDAPSWLGGYSSLKAGRASISPKDQKEVSLLLNLPSEVHLYILSFLDAQSLCCLARTCLYMENISSDPLLWRRLLLKDTSRWSVIGHLSHPQIYQDACSDLHPKHVAKIKRFLVRLQGYVPKILMFGSGLECLPFVQMLMWEESSPYKPIGLYPGKDGIGSGFCIEHVDGSPVNLVTLYTSIRAERQSDHHVNRLMTSDTPGVAKLTEAVGDLCRQADAFMLVIDAINGPSQEVDRYMLNAMLQSGHVQTPILVVNITQSNSSIHSPIVVADKLELCKLAHHPWQVRSVSLGTFSGLQEGLHWLLRTVN